METAIQTLLICLEILLIYFLRYKILDLILRILQAINAPLDFVISRLEQTQSSIIRLNYRQRVLNLLLVSISIIMLVSEYGTLREILNVTASTEPLNIGFSRFVFQLTVGELAAISYLTIATLLGFGSMEVLGVRNMFQGIFFNDPVSVVSDSGNATISIPKAKKFLAWLFFLMLVALAIFQGILAIQRFQLSSIDAPLTRITFKYAIHAFYFILGFLTPIIAAFALLSFDIFLAIIAKFFIGLIQFIQKLIAVIYMAVEVLLLVVAAPFEKLLEFFGIYQERNITEKNKEEVTPAVKLAPLQNNDPVYFENKATMYRTYMSFRKQGSGLMFLSDTYAIHLSLPSHERKIAPETSFQDVAEHIKETYPALKGRKIIFKYIDAEGTMRDISLDDKVVYYTHFTDTIIVDAFNEEQEEVPEVRGEADRADAGRGGGKRDGGGEGTPADSPELVSHAPEKV